MDKEKLIRMVEDMKHSIEPNDPLLSQSIYQMLDEILGELKR
jgi:hypothetical protein